MAVAEILHVHRLLVGASLVIGHALCTFLDQPVLHVEQRAVVADDIRRNVRLAREITAHGAQRLIQRDLALLQTWHDGWALGSPLATLAAHA